jgi:hypothetical protein
LFCLNTEANMLEEPGAVVPHAGILCGGCRVTGISTVTRKDEADRRVLRRRISLKKKRNYVNIVKFYTITLNKRSITYGINHL